MTMSSILLQFNSTPVVNAYDFTIHDVSRVRFGDGTIMATRHAVPPVVHPDAHAGAVRSAAASAGAAFPMPPMMQG